MGDYADDLMYDAIDAMGHGGYIYSEVDESDPRIDEDEEVSSSSNVSVSMDSYEFKSIKKETNKAWLLIMSGGNEMWFPKSKCKIDGDKIILPEWLKLKIIADTNAT